MKEIELTFDKVLETCPSIEEIEKRNKEGEEDFQTFLKIVLDNIETTKKQKFPLRLFKSVASYAICMDKFGKYFNTSDFWIEKENKKTSELEPFKTVSVAHLKEEDKKTKNVYISLVIKNELISNGK